MDPSDGDSAAGHVSENAIKDQPPQDSRPRRKKTLSQKALLNYEANRDEQRQKLDCVWERIANDLREVEQATNAETQQAATGRIRKEYGRYQALSERYVAYLSGINAEQSQLELALQKTTDRDRARAVQKALMDTGKTPDRATKSRDSEHANSEHSSKSAGPRLHGSRRSGGSTRSEHSIATTTSTAATRARAEAAAARTRASFTRKEVAMKLERARLEEKEKSAAAANERRKAELDAELQILQLEREAAAMEVQAEILQAAAEQHGGEHRSDRTISDVSEVRAQRTVDYVHNQAAVHDGSNELPAEQVAPELSGVLKYLVRRDLVSTGLVKFDDHPENYRVWKATFKSMVQTLEVTANEELDLLVNWLGRESSVYAKRLRSVHVDNPAAGLEIVWERLEDCYGRPEVIEDALFKRIGSFPKFSDKDTHKLRELGDLLLELEAAKADPHLTGLGYLDTARGVNPIAEKLPHRLQEMWISKGSRYKEDHHVSFPPFSFFSKFVRDQARMRNDPSFAFGTTGSTFPRFPKNEKVTSREGFRNTPVSVHATDVTPGAVDHYSPATAERMEDPNRQCPLHKKPHPLRKCRVFREKPLQERKSLLKQFGICFRCCSSTNHLARDCKVVIKCDDCDSTEHTRALHPDSSKPLSSSLGQDPEDDTIHHGLSPDVSSKCTEVCGEGYGGRSCSKICLVSVCHSSTPQKAVRMYAILDDQSNRSLARTEFFNLFDVQGESSPYTLKTCAGTAETTGRRASGFLVANIDGSVKLSLPTLIECNQMINNRNEIPTPDAARHHPHLKAIESLIPPLDTEAQILLLLGRDILRVHKVRQQCNGPPDAPFAQRLDLGWVIIGDVCLGRTRKPDCVTNFKTNVLENGRPSLFEPCRNHFLVKEKFTDPVNPTQHVPPTQGVPIKDYSVEETTDTLFQTTKDDDQPAPSVEDRKFLNIMDNEVFKDESCSWVAPLPFRVPRPRLPNNKELVQSRLASLRRTLQKRPEMKEHFATFMNKMFRNGHAEEAPPLREEEECWYLPIFGVYHPRKPGETRVVFDSSAQFKGTSLNNVLLTGPDLTNNLLGVLIRFRKDCFAVTVDIQQMFYCFLVREDHRNYLRFLWFRNNDIHDKVVEYRMRVHVFGNSPSPAVATYGLRKTAQEGEEEFGKDAREFVEKNFYVDDGLKSLPTADGVIDLVKRTQQMLAVCNLRLHKIVSNSSRVMEAFPKEDHTKDLRELDLSHDIPPIQRSLGICWDVKKDVFTFRVPVQDTPFTRRGVLSMVNSVYDPFGFVAPVTIQGKSLLRELVTETCEWDSPLPENKRKEWENWKDSLQAFEQLEVPRTYAAVSLSTAQQKEVHIFSDASTKAVAAVAYLRATDSDGACHVGFIMGKAKLAPRPQHTIPRLELCGAVLAVELAELIQKEIDTQLDVVHFYTDSKVVLGYIHNQTRRFYVYVGNRVERIRKSTQPEQWHYVRTDANPADLATRFVPAARLQETAWLTGPEFLNRQEESSCVLQNEFELMDPNTDAEIRPEASVSATSVTTNGLGTNRFSRFSSWPRLMRAVAYLIRAAGNFRCPSRADEADLPRGCLQAGQLSVEHLSLAKNLVIRSVQLEAYANELECLSQGKGVQKSSPLWKLDPRIDDKGLLRVGGRLNNAQLSQEERRPLIIPGKHHVALLLVRYYHEQIKHQGRHITEGAIRSAGFWIIGAKRCIASYIHGCVMCCRLRGRQLDQKMADLPVDRLSTEPAFTYVGVDVFGPWNVTARRTRGGEASSKRWAVLFTCMSIRAVHIEVIESMDASSFINALRRFFALRGPAKQLRSDCGTNFVGACSELNLRTSGLHNDKVQAFLSSQNCSWVFNPPHSSHFGGAWERMIGIARRILDSMLLEHGPSRLSHEVLVTFLAEVSAIINARPLVPVSMDPECWDILSPSTLLTQKVGGDTLPPSEFNVKDLYRSQWRQVQWLADSFWHRWRREFLTTLQSRRKWQDSRRDLKEGDIVLLRDKQVHRNEWPMGVIVNTFPSADGKVRKVEIKTATRGELKTFRRPVTETVLLISKED
ncbi:uncharacterized protein LOC121838334 [Ixodes scapularis]|uniref:uncharacterized protein LOC121838334 n=1 Tax=Ixodes scapularis TaxID=6945 RepID=UPI001C3920B6|nr:uncharacterized protein LOC121838334 [Ixodes scapularis]